MMNLKKTMIAGLSVAALGSGLVVTNGPASAANGYVVGDTYVSGHRYGDNHYSRKHPDGLAFEGPVAAAGDVVGGTAAGVGAVVGGTLNGAAGVAAGVTGGPYPRAGAPYYQRAGTGYYQGGQRYVRRGAYLYPVGPEAAPQDPRY